MTTTPRPIADLDVPLPSLQQQIADLVERQSADRAVDKLRALLADPPLGHTKKPQPDAWYEAVFDAIACACPDPCNCTPQEKP